MIKVPQHLSPQVRLKDVHSPEIHIVNSKYHRLYFNIEYGFTLLIIINNYRSLISRYPCYYCLRSAKIYVCDIKYSNA